MSNLNIVFGKVTNQPSSTVPNTPQYRIHHAPLKRGNTPWWMIDSETGEVVEYYRPAQPAPRPKPQTPIKGSWCTTIGVLPIGGKS